AYEILDSVKDVLRKRHRGKDDFIGYWVPKRSARRLERIEKMIKIALGSIAGFSLFVSGIGIMNICLVSVGEKTREIGLRKSVGAKRIHIFYQFLTESICLCFCGGVLGVAGGWVAGHGMAHLAVRIVPIVPKWPVVLSLPWILTAVAFSLIMGISFGVYPAMRAARLSPIDALRTEN
ncbi:MAG: FtsX-like permease family protein, partial [Candidatus Poribacteria bacterium]|nr:FtsX-like permease family protein [Candidatus Poribacteria bacterium]